MKIKHYNENIHYYNVTLDARPTGVTLSSQFTVRAVELLLYSKTLCFCHNNLFILLYLGVHGRHFCSDSLFCLSWICGFLTSTDLSKSKHQPLGSCSIRRVCMHIKFRIKLNDTITYVWQTERNISKKLKLISARINHNRTCRIDISNKDSMSITEHNKWVTF